MGKRKKTDNPREGWEDGTPPPLRDFKPLGKHMRGAKVSSVAASKAMLAAIATVSSGLSLFGQPPGSRPASMGASICPKLPEPVQSPSACTLTLALG